MRPGELFVALQGPRFDGHDFIPDVLRKGAAGVLGLRGRMESSAAPDLPGRFFIGVPDTLRALGDLAASWRGRMRARVAAVTGSNGKTTTKEMTARILEGSCRALKTEGNLNNLIGLPLMLCKLAPDHEAAVLEMGMSAPGEIRRLKEIARPQVSVITNIGRAHLEFLGSIAGVAHAKGELWEGLEAEDGIAVNADDPWVVRLAGAASCRKLTFGIDNEAQVRGEELRPGKRGIGFSLVLQGTRQHVELAACGRHNVYNALAAASVASLLGLSPVAIRAGLEGFQSFDGRGRIVVLGRNVQLLDDTYNANPDSLAATLAAYGELKGGSRGLVILGDMLELGPGSAAAHEKAGRQIGAMGCAHLFFLGEMAGELARGSLAAGMEKERVHAGQDYAQILERVAGALEDGDWILVKGSRRMRMERIIEDLAERLGKKV